MRPEDLRAALVDLNVLMVTDLLRMWRPVLDEDVEYLRDKLQSEVPGIVDPYLAAAGDITADWYEAQAPELGYIATPAALPDEGQLQATARWAAGTVLTKSPVSPLDLLAGSMQRALFNESRETIIENAETEPGARWARHASANACEFCKMLATRSETSGSLYTSKEAAVRVVGRGKEESANFDPVTGRRRRGGQAKGVRPRGNQALGEKYHDHCHCIAVPVRPGQSYDPPPYVEEWEAEYTRARKAADGVDAKSILSAWRKLQPE